MTGTLRIAVFLMTSVGLVSTGVSADSLTLRDHRIVQGTFVGATAQTIRFQVNEQIKQFSLSDVVALAFSPPDAAEATGDKPAPRLDRGVIVGTETDLMVHLPDNIPSRIGSSFQAVLSEDFRAGEVIIAPAGSQVYGHLVNGGATPGTLKLVLTTIRINEKLLPIKTQVHLLMVENQGLSLNRAATAIEPENSTVAFRLRQPFSIRLASN